MLDTGDSRQCKFNERLVFAELCLCIVPPVLALPSTAKYFAGSRGGLTDQSSDVSLALPSKTIGAISGAKFQIIPALV